MPDDPPGDDGAEGLTGCRMQERRGICWSHAATVGNIAVASAMLRGEFDRALIACDFTPAGKYRNGAARWWCRTHQAYWGVKADLAAFDPARAKACSASAEPLEFVLDPLVLEMRIPAIAISGIAGVFANPYIMQVNVTPPAVHALVDARRSGRLLGCLDCARCGHPHLDLGSFAKNEHRRHYCGNCGNDSTHSRSPIVSNPLFALNDHFGARLTFE